MFFIAHFNFYLISFTGQRIPVIDTDGGSAVKGFKLRRQPTESTRERTCCWRSRKQLARSSPASCLFSISNQGCDVIGEVRNFLLEPKKKF